MRLGVKVTTSAQAGRSNTGVTSGRFIVAGMTERGPAAPTLVRSLAAFNAVFGGRTSYNSPLYDALRTFWEEGGSEAVVVRATGPAATKGQVSLDDVAAGTPLITLTATSAGAWSEQVRVAISDVPATDYAPARVRLTISGPDGEESFTAEDAGSLVQAVNSRSALVSASLLGEATAKPAPTATGEEGFVTLSAGTDDRASVDVAVLAAALDTVGAEWGTGAVAAPGLPAGVVGDYLLDHARRFSRVALLAAEQDATEAQVVEAAQALSIHEAADHGALFYPWVIVPDGSASRVAPPEGFAAAKRATAHSRVGAWRAPAGDFSPAAWVLGTATVVDSGMNERLADQNVTGIVSGGGKVRVYGWWSLSQNAEHFEMLSARDTLNYLVDRCSGVLEEFVFDQIDGRNLLLSKIESALVGVLDPIARGGGLFEFKNTEQVTVDPGYSVVVDSTLNTPESIAQNRVVARVSVRLAPTANLIELEITKAPFAGAL